MSAATFSGDSTVEYAEGAGLLKTTAGKFCIGLELGGVRSRKTAYYTPGVDGGGVKNFGIEGISVTLRVKYIGASEEDVKGEWLADLVELSAATLLTLTVSGTASLKGCVVDGGASRLEQPSSTGLASAQFEAAGTLVIDAKRIE